MSENEHPLDRAAREAIDPRRPDRPRDEQGRFASKDVEPEVGRQAELHQHGHRTLLDHKLETEGPDPDTKIYNSNNPADLAEAHADLQARRKQTDDDARQSYIDQWRKSAPQVEALPDDVALSRDEGAKRYSALKEQDRREATAKALLAEHEAVVRDLGPALEQPIIAENPQPDGQQQPAQGQHVDIQETIRQATALWEHDPASAYALVKQADAAAADPNAPTEVRAAYSYTQQAKQALEQANPWLLEVSAQVDPEAAKANAQLRQALENPVVRAELQQRFAQAEQAEQAYVQGLQQNTQHILAATLAEYPELVGVPEQSLPHVLKAMPQERAQKAVAAIQRIQQMSHQLHQIKGAQQQIAQQQWVREWDQYSRAQDAAFDKRHPELADPRAKMEVVTDIYEMVQQAGVSREQLHQFYNSPAGRSAAVQEMLLLAARQHRGQKAMTAAAREARKPSVPVMKPGMAGPRPGRSDVEYAALSKQLDAATGKDAIKIATRMRQLARKARS
jgi:hypothetical protein